MSMALGSNSRRTAEPNITPLIDVSLVLLIIFRLITPSVSTGLNTLMPQPPDKTSAVPREGVVITVLKNQTLRLNDEHLALSDLDQRLLGLFRNAANRVIFVRGEKAPDCGQVAEVIDIARAAGLDRVALKTEP